MADNVYFVIDMTEITKSEYDEWHQKDKKKLLLDRAFGYVYNHPGNLIRTAYLQHNGKYYKGDLQQDQTYRDMETYDFLGVQVSQPQGVFKRKPAKPKLVA